jgi:hypothetical protein
MPDPRAVIKHNRIENTALPFVAAAGLIAGYNAALAGGHAKANGNYAVTLVGDNTVDLAGDGEVVLGVLMELSKDGFASVVQDGVQYFRKSAAAIVRNGSIVGALGVGGPTDKGFVKNGTAGAETGRGLVCNIADANAIEVLFFG